MGYIIISLMPYILGSVLEPIQNIMNILILRDRHQGLLKSIAFVGGMTTLRLLQGLVFGLIFVSPTSAEKGSVALTLKLILGILLLITAYKKWRKEDDPDAPPPSWLTMIESSTIRKAFGLGFGFLLIMVKAWVFTLGAISVIAEAELSQSTSILAYLLFVLFAQSLLLLSILFRSLMPNRSQIFFEQASDWLTRNNRPIVVTASLVFGLLFFYQGASGLLN